MTRATCDREPEGATALAPTPARKVRHPRLPGRLRVLAPEGGGAPLVYHKDVFEYGAEAQLYAGVREGLPVVVRRLSVLEAHRPDGLRVALSHYRDGRQDTHELGAALADVRLTAEVAAARGQAFDALVTDRRPGGGPAKIYQVLEPRQADLIEIVLALRGRPARVGAAVAGACIGAIAADLERLAAHGIVHHDVREENVLVGRDAFGAPTVELTDFGHARRVAPGLPVPKGELASLGQLALRLLDPDARQALVQGRREPADVLAGARRASPGWADLVEGLLCGRLTSAADVHARLAALGAVGPEADALARPVLLSAAAKARDLAPLLADIDAWLAAATAGGVGPDEGAAPGAARLTAALADLEPRGGAVA